MVTMQSPIVYDTPIDVPAEQPAVSEKVLQHVTQRLRGTKRIMISWEPSPGRWKKINGMRLPDAAKPNQSPGVEPDDVATSIMLAIDAHHQSLRKGDELVPAQQYRVMFLRETTDGSPQRPSFEYLYDPSGESTTAVVEEERSTETVVASYQTLVSTLLGAVSGLSTQLSSSQSVLEKIAANNLNQLKPFSDMIGYMGQMFISGHQMQMQAMAFLYDQRKVEVESAAANKKWEMMLRQVGTPLLAYLQHQGWIPRGQSGGMYTEGNEGDAEASDSATNSEYTPPSEDQIDPRTMADPFAAFVRVWGSGLRPRQWHAIRSMLTAKEMDLLTRMLEASNDREALQLYDAIWSEQAIPMEKLMRLYSALDEDQREPFQMIAQLADAARGRYGEPETK